MNEYYECGDGWIPLIEEAKTIIAKYNQKIKEEDLDTEPLEFIQIKEKWGGLRIYINYYVIILLQGGSKTWKLLIKRILIQK